MNLLLLFTLTKSVNVGEEKIVRDLNFFEHFSFDYFANHIPLIPQELDGKYRTLYLSGFEYVKLGEWDNAVEVFNKVIIYSSSDYLKCQGSIALAYTWYHKKVYHKAANYFYQAFSLVERDIDYVSISVGLGQVYSALEDHHQAIYHYTKILSLSNVLSEVRVAQAKACVNLAGLYAEINDWKSSDTMLQASLEYYIAENELKNTARIYSIQAISSYQRRAFTKAIDLLNKAYEVASNNMFSSLCARLLFQMGVVYLVSGDKKKGVGYLEEAASKSKAIYDISLEGVILKILAENSLELNDLQSATGFIKKAIANFEKEEDHERLEASYEILVSIYENVGDYRQALDYSKKVAENKWAAYKKLHRYSEQTKAVYSITQDFSLENELYLIEKQDQLQADLSSKKQWIEEQNHKLQILNNQLQSLTSAAAHSLREPLRNINSFTQLIHKKVESHLDKESQEYMQFVTDGVVQMQDLLDALTQYADHQTHPKVAEPLDMNRVLSDAFLDLEEKILYSNASIEAEKLPTIVGYYSDMVCLFRNLLDNAIKFGNNEFPNIKITTEEQENCYRFTVRDNGSGIPDEESKSVFELFKKGSNAEKEEGIGVGLAICRQIVLNHQGQIWVEKSPLGGCEFNFTISKE